MSDVLNIKKAFIANLSSVKFSHFFPYEVSFLFYTLIYTIFSSLVLSIDCKIYLRDYLTCVSLPWLSVPWKTMQGLWFILLIIVNLRIWHSTRSQKNKQYTFVEWIDWGYMFSFTVQPSKLLYPKNFKELYTNNTSWLYTLAMIINFNENLFFLYTRMAFFTMGWCYLTQ